MQPNIRAPKSTLIMPSPTIIAQCSIKILPSQIIIALVRSGISEMPHVISVKSRVNSEKTRVNSEKTHVMSERVRANSEMTRVISEIPRIIAHLPTKSARRPSKFCAETDKVLHGDSLRSARRPPCKRGEKNSRQGFLSANVVLCFPYMREIRLLLWGMAFFVWKAIRFVWG